MNTPRTLLAVAAAALLTPAVASAAQPGQGRAGIGSTDLSAWLVLDPGPVDGTGVGARLTFPIAPGVIHHPRIKDEFVLEPGLDFVHYSDRVGYAPNHVDYSWNGLLFVVGGAWDFWLTPHFALYPKLDLGWWHGWYSHRDNRYSYHDFGDWFLQGAAGMIYRFDRVSLRVELGSGLLRVGFGFAL